MSSLKTETLRVRSGGETHGLPVNDADRSRTLADFLGKRGLPLNMRCGGRGLCSGCQIEHGEHDHEAHVDDHDLEKACCIKISDTLARSSHSPQSPHLPHAHAAITIPARSLLRQQPSVVDDFRINIPMARDPIASHARYGASVDVGTTTVAVLLSDLESGKTLARASAFNAQIRHGEDVLTRIELCFTRDDAVRELQAAVTTGTIQPLLVEACARAGLSPDDVGVMVIAGNTTMQHLLAGENPRSLGVHPFTPVFLEHRAYAPAELGLAFGRDATADRVHLLPGLSAYVGADLTAGLIATGMAYEEGPTLLVDVGTNGEIIAKIGDKLVGCATAAGPAFEGAGLTCGTRAVSGAIERVRMTADPFTSKIDIIGDPAARPVGMCGSAYIDFLWEARRAGLLLESGRYAPQAELPSGAHVEADQFGRKFRISARGASGPLWISERDVVRLLQAKAAIGAGITVLLKVLGLVPRDVKRLYLAGGFGMHLSLEHAIGCGLLPGFTPEQIQIVGNTSLAGAYLALNDQSLLEEMRAACARFEAVELNLHPDFEDTYIDHLTLP